jgi:aminocarboxymuconate-semialdehyde decarboxylase
LVIDTHAHMIVPEILQEAAPAESWRPRIYYEGSQQVIAVGGREIRSTVHDFVDVERILLAQEQAGVTRTVLCPWVNLLRYEAPLAEGLDSARTQNEALARLVDSHPGQLSALGTVPLQDPEQAARELQALCSGTPLSGVEVAASVNGVYLGDERFADFWAAAEECRALVFIHPTTRGFSAPVFQEYYLWNTVGNPLETTITAAHMVMAGVLERHPRLRVLLAHGGGAVLALRGRLDHAHSFQKLARQRLQEPPSASLCRFYFDTLTHSIDVLRSLLDFAGPEHLVVGSDYPFDMGAARPAELVRQLGLPSAEENWILQDNALHLLGKDAWNGQTA